MTSRNEPTVVTIATLHAERILARVPLLREVGGLPGLRGLIREVGTFGLIGLLNAVADILLFTFLHAGAGVGPLSAKVVSGLITIAASYYANRRWTWPHRPGEAQQRRQLMQFAAICGAGLLLAEACLGLSHYVLELHSLLADNLSANVIGLGLGTAWRFYASRRWVFTATPNGACAEHMNTPEWDGAEWDDQEWDDVDWTPTSRIDRAVLAEILAATEATTGRIR